MPLLEDPITLEQVRRLHLSGLIDVLLDGNDITRICVEASPKQGYVVVHDLTDDGKLQVEHTRGESRVCTKRIEGDVIVRERRAMAGGEG